MKENDLTPVFAEKAALVSAIVHWASDMKDAMQIAVEVCSNKNAREDLYHLALEQENKKIMAAVGLSSSDLENLSMSCDDEGIKLITDGIRNYPGGIDVGITMADYGIAETGTLVLNSDSEDVRLATMLCETHVAILEKSCIRQTALEISDELENMTCSASSYTAFITGASRTADIERVLAVGVHGPLELHIILTGE